MSDKIPTAEELLVLQAKGKTELITWENTLIFARNLSRLHVEAALKAASEKLNASQNKEYNEKLR